MAILNSLFVLPTDNIESSLMWKMPLLVPVRYGSGRSEGLKSYPSLSDHKTNSLYVTNTRSKFLKFDNKPLNRISINRVCYKAKQDLLGGYLRLLIWTVRPALITRRRRTIHNYIPTGRLNGHRTWLHSFI